MPIHRHTFMRGSCDLCRTRHAASARVSRDAPAADARDAALLARMTLAEKVNQLMLLSKGTMTGPDSAGRPNKPAEDLAREGIGFQMSAFEWSAADVNRIQRIAVKESRLGIPVVFATDIIHGYWTVFPVPLGLARHVRSRRRARRRRHLRARRLFAWTALDVRAHGRSSGRSALGPRRRNLR